MSLFLRECNAASKFSSSGDNRFWIKPCPASQKKTHEKNQLARCRPCGRFDIGNANTCLGKPDLSVFIRATVVQSRGRLTTVLMRPVETPMYVFLARENSNSLDYWCQSQKFLLEGVADAISSLFSSLARPHQKENLHSRAGQS